MRARALSGARANTTRTPKGNRVLGARAVRVEVEQHAVERSPQQLAAELNKQWWSTNNSARSLAQEKQAPLRRAGERGEKQLAVRVTPASSACAMHSEATHQSLS